MLSNTPCTVSLCHETNPWLVICQDKTVAGHSIRLRTSFQTSDVMLQVKYLLGYNVPRANQLHKMLYSLVSGLHQLRWPELVMGLCWIALLLSIKRVAAHHRCLLFCCPSGSVLMQSSDPWQASAHGQV